MSYDDAVGLHFRCSRCDQPLTEPGSLLFSPPLVTGWVVVKHHVCVECYDTITDQFGGPFEGGQR